VTALHDLTALEQAAAIRRREVSPVELAEHYLERSERLGPQVGAFITLTPELALEQARAAERAVLDADDPAVLPVLHGVVVPIKDLFFLGGVRSTFGSAVYDVVPWSDDNVVAAIKAGGAVITGKTNTPEFGLPCYTESTVAPPARSPWDLSRGAGGSSGGAAAAVAAGLAPVAHGSDGGGSVRIPASCCGLVGIKPTRGRVSNGPLRDPVGDIVTSGPLARTVRDAAALLDVMAVPFPGDPYPAPGLAPGATFLAAADRKPGRLRIGRYSTPVIALADVDPACLEAYERASGLLASMGHEVQDVPPPWGPEAFAAFESLWDVLALLTPVAPDDEERLAPLTRWLRERGRKVSGIQVAGAVSAMRLVARAAMVATEPYDVVLTPTLAQLPAPVGGLRDDDDPAADFEAQKRFTPFTSPYNVSGQPALTIPLHWTADGLPVGVQLVGRTGDEATLVSVAAAIEEASPWLDRHPSMW
jgi:amidase